MALMQTLQDNFDFGGLDSGKWSSFGGGIVIGTSLNCQITTNNDYQGILSLTTYDLTGSYMYSQVVNAGNQALASFEVYPVYLIKDTNNKLYIRITGNQVSCWKVVANVTTQIGSNVAYNSGTMSYFRIRESGGNTSFQYATDPTGSWTDLVSAVANPITVTALSGELLVGTWNSENSTAILDNVNTYATQYQFSWKGYSWNKRIHAGAPSNNQSWDSANVLAPDGNDYLTIKVSNPTGSAPFGSEFFSVQRGLGYGIYKAVIGTRLDNIPQAIGFGGMFTFDFTAPPDYKEVDVHETRYYNSNPNRRILHSHVYNNGGNREFIVTDMDIPSDIVQTHTLYWVENRLIFDSYLGTGIGGTNYFHTEHLTNLPTPGLERVHFNIWVDTSVAGYANVAETSVVIRDFSFQPLRGFYVNQFSFKQ